MCLSCFAIPSVTIQLLATSAAIIYGQRSLCKNARKWTRRVTFGITVVFSLALAALGLFLLVLATNNDYRSRKFANIFVKQNSRETPFNEQRCSILKEGNVTGRVLEFGPGPGTNFKCFQKNRDAYARPIERYVAVEPNPYFEEELRKERDARGLDFPVEFLGLRGEDVDLPVLDEGSFDVALMTHVLCSVGSVENVLANAEKALKPGGRIVFMEHVIAPRGTYMSYVQGVVAPILNIVGNGCTFRDLKVVIGDYLGDRFDVQMMDFEADLPLFMYFIRPHIKGVATKNKD